MADRSRTHWSRRKPALERDGGRRTEHHCWRSPAGPRSRSDGCCSGPGDAITYVPFPLIGTLSLVAQPDDMPVEAATIGNEGAAKLPSALGSQTASQELIGQVAGEMITVPIEIFTKHVQEEDRFRDLVYGYVEALVVQISLTAACNAVHHVNQRCARWLLQTHDRVAGRHVRTDPGVLGRHARRPASHRLDRPANAEAGRLHHLQQGLDHGRGPRRLGSCGMSLLRDDPDRVLTPRPAT